MNKKMEEKTLKRAGHGSSKINYTTDTRCSISIHVFETARNLCAQEMLNIKFSLGASQVAISSTDSEGT